MKPDFKNMNIIADAFGAPAAAPAAAGEDDGDLAGGRGAFPGVVQKNVYRLPQMLLAAPDSDIFLNVRSEGVARFKEYRLKGENGIVDQTAEIDG